MTYRKKVIIYGLYNIFLRRCIENFLDENYEIIGYSDSFQESDGLDGNRFIPVSQISKSNVDYIVFAIDTEKAIVSVKNMLGSIGIKEEKIIVPYDFFDEKKSMYIET